MLPYHIGMRSSTSLASGFAAIVTRNEISPIVPFQIYDLVKKQRQMFTLGANASYIFNSSEIARCAITESKDKTLLAVTAGRKVFLMNKATGDFIKEFTLSAPIVQSDITGAEPKISADNNELFVALNVAPWYQIFNINTGADISSELDPLYRPSSRIAAFDYSPNGEVLAIAHTDSKGLAIYYVGPLTPPGFDPYDFGDVQPPATGALPTTACCSFSPNNTFFALSSDAPNALRLYNSFTWVLNRTVQPVAGFSTRAVCVNDASDTIVIGNRDASGANFYRTGPGNSDPISSMNPGNWQPSNWATVKFAQNDSVLAYTGSSNIIRVLDIPSAYTETTVIDSGILGSSSVGSFVESFVSGNFNYHLAIPDSGFREFRAQQGTIKQLFDWDSGTNLEVGGSSPILGYSFDKTRAVFMSKTQINAGATVNQTHISTWNALTGQRISRFTAPQTANIGAGNTFHAGLKISPDNAHVAGRFLPDPSVGMQIRNLSNLSSVITNIASLTGDATQLKQVEYSPDGAFLVAVWGASNIRTTNQTVAVYNVSSGYSLVNLKTYDSIATDIRKIEIHPTTNDILVTFDTTAGTFFEILQDPFALTLKYSSQANSIQLTTQSGASYYKGGSKIIYRTNTGIIREIDATTPGAQTTVSATGYTAPRGGNFQVDPLGRFIDDSNGSSILGFRDSNNINNTGLSTLTANDPGGVTNTNIAVIIRQIRS